MLIQMHQKSKKALYIKMDDAYLRNWTQISRYKQSTNRESVSAVNLDVSTLISSIKTLIKSKLNRMFGPWISLMRTT